MNSFYNNKLFRRKNVLIIVPHMDDEINVAGSMIYNLSIMECKISVLYTTNGNGSNQGETRIKEAKEALNILAGDHIEISVCDFVDQPRGNGEHVLSKHSAQIENKMEEIIVSSKPDIIICVDMDEHPDHMRTSICFEKVMGKVLETNESYMPIVYKGFAYKTAYFSYDDIKQGDYPLLESRCYRGKLDNPTYSYKERVRFPVLRECLCVENNLADNIIAKALSAHRTQNAVSHTGRIINSDIVFFERRTDNLLFGSKITVSSGNQEYLKDFVTVDVENVMQKKRVYTNYLWQPENGDTDRVIYIMFNTSITCNHLVFYQSVDKKSRVEQIEIFFDDGTSIIWNKINQKNIREDIYFFTKHTKSIKIQILKMSGHAGMSELEVYEDQERPYDYIKIMQKGNFVDRLICTKSNIQYDVYGYRHKSGSEIVPKDRVKENIYHRERDYIRVSLKEEPEIYDEIPIERMTIEKYLCYYILVRLYRIRGRFRDLYNELNLLWKKCRMLIRQYGL